MTSEIFAVHHFHWMHNNVGMSSFPDDFVSFREALIFLSF